MFTLSLKAKKVIYSTWISGSFLRRKNKLSDDLKLLFIG